MKTKSHTNLLNGFLPSEAGTELAESTLKSPTDAGDLCLFHLLMFGVNGNENLLLDTDDDTLPGVLGATLSLGLLVGLALAFADTVGLM